MNLVMLRGRKGWMDGVDNAIQNQVKDLVVLRYWENPAVEVSTSCLDAIETQLRFGTIYRGPGMPGWRI